MTWVRRVERADAHHCALPDVCAYTTTKPAGAPGDLWRCDTCKALWRITPDPWTNGGFWVPATLWQRLRYRRT